MSSAPATPLVVRLRSPFLGGGISAAVAWWSVLFLTHFLVLREFVSTPYYWDALGYVFPHALDIYQSGMSPILTRYDVGHPTLYPFCVACWMHLVGIVPLAGHAATWAFSALFMVAFHRLVRSLGVEGWGAIVSTVGVVTFPIVFSSVIQMQLDYPLAALHLASVICWAKKRFPAYIVLGGLACLTKLYGWLLIPALLATCAVTNGRWWVNGARKTVLLESAVTLSPVLLYAAYLGIAASVRGPGLTVNHVSGNSLVPPCTLEEYARHVRMAWNVLFQYPMIDRLLVALIVAGGGALTAFGLGGSWWTPFRLRLVVGLAVLCLGMNAAFFQITGLCSRYNLLAVAVIIAACAGCVRACFGGRAVALVGTLFVLTNVTLWHPENGAKLPQPLSGWLTREPIRVNSMYEVDLRFLDAIELTRWCLKSYWARASNDPRNALLITHWPMSVGLHHPGIGYFDRTIPCANARDWADVRFHIAENPQHHTFFVMAIQPIGDLLSPEGARENGFVLVREKNVGELTGQLYRFQRP